MLDRFPKIGNCHSTTKTVAFGGTRGRKIGSALEGLNGTARMGFLSTARVGSEPIVVTSQVPSRPVHADVHQADSRSDSDETLLQRVASGDSEALSHLFRRYAKVAFVIAQRILGDSAEADDCVQEVFLYFHRKSCVFSSQKGSASSWIIQTIYHQALQFRMRLALRSQRLELLTEDKTRDVGANVIVAEYEHSLEGTVGRTKLREMLKSLSPDQWDTLRLHFFEGYTLAEIAEKKHQSVGNIRHHFYRGLEKLRSSAFRSESNGRISSGKEMSGLPAKAL